MILLTLHKDSKINLQTQDNMEELGHELGNEL